MPPKYPVNQRVRDLMAALGETRVDPFYKKYFGDDTRSERLRTAVNDKNLIKLDFLLEITEKIVEVEGKKVNGHWLLTGEGEMFLQEKHTAATNSDEAAIFKAQAEKFRKAADALARVNLINAQTIAELTSGEMVE